MADERIKRVLIGNFVHSTEEKHLQIHHDKAIGINNEGGIVFIEDAAKMNELDRLYDMRAVEMTRFDGRQFLMPGFVDTHIHAPQYTYTGTGYDLPLLRWLDKYTFPMEAKFKDLEFATRAYEKVVRRTLKCGTTTASYFATIHLEATKALCDIAERLGQRAYIGKVNMDMNSPEYYIENTQQSVQDTEEFIQYVLGKESPMLTPVITPRFAITCSFELMCSLAELARKYQAPVQSHLSENLGEIAFVKQQFPQCAHYTGVYKDAGLLTERCYMAHCCHLDDDEAELMANNNTGISHCPASNFNLRSGLTDVKALAEKSIKIGLGTDVSGGHSPSMLNAIHKAVMTSNVIAMQTANNYHPISHEDAFYYATLGGSSVLGLDEKIGNFQVGKYLDAVLVDPDADNTPFDCFDYDSFEDIIQKFLYLGDDRNIKQVYVAGRLVAGTGMNN